MATVVTPDGAAPFINPSAHFFCLTLIGQKEAAPSNFSAGPGWLLRLLPLTFFPRRDSKGHRLFIQARERLPRAFSLPTGDSMHPNAEQQPIDDDLVQRLREKGGL